MRGDSPPRVRAQPGPREDPHCRGHRPPEDSSQSSEDSRGPGARRVEERMVVLSRARRGCLMARTEGPPGSEKTASVSSQWRGWDGLEGPARPRDVGECEARSQAGEGRPFPSGRGARGRRARPQRVCGWACVLPISRAVSSRHWGTKACGGTPLGRVMPEGLLHRDATEGSGGTERRRTGR